MNVIIDNYNFYEMECMKYYTFPKTWSADKMKSEAKNRVFGEYLGANKMDGFWSMLIKDDEGTVYLRTRTRGVDGNYADKYDHVPHWQSFVDQLPNGTVLLGETYLPLKPGSRNVTTILGCLTEKALERQKKEENKLHFYCFDVLAYNGVSNLKMPASSRFELIQTIPATSEYFHKAEYLRGEALWNNLQSYLADGGEGMVITREDGLYAPGKRPNYTLKIKKELSETIDCVIIAGNEPTMAYGGGYLSTWEYWYNAKTGEKLIGRYYDESRSNSAIMAVTKAFALGWAGSFRLGLYNGGKLEYFCDVSGLTDEMKENWKSYIGRVATINGMEISKTDNGISIRHPKLVEIRDAADKGGGECGIEQILG